MTNLSLAQIKTVRKKYHLNQKELATRAGVSQSLIAKIEAGKIDPSFSKAQQIFSALEHIREKEEVKANEIMNPKVIVIGINDTVKDAIKIMKMKGISQVPVLSRKKVCGLITEGVIMQSISAHPEKGATLKVAEIMEESPPIVSPTAGLKVLLSLLQNYPIIIVAEKGDIKGVISKTDILGKIE